jgi:hypothetical protein
MAHYRPGIQEFILTFGLELNPEPDRVFSAADAAVDTLLRIGESKVPGINFRYPLS